MLTWHILRGGLIDFSAQLISSRRWPNQSPLRRFDFSFSFSTSVLMSRFAGYAPRLQLRSQIVKCVFGQLSCGALQAKHVVMQENCSIKPTLPLFFTCTPIFYLVKLLLVLDGSKFAWLIDGCWLVAMETAFPLERNTCAGNSLCLNVPKRRHVLVFWSTQMLLLTDRRWFVCARLKCHLFRSESCLTRLFTRAKSLDGFFFFQQIKTFLKRHWNFDHLPIHDWINTLELWCSHSSWVELEKTAQASIHWS